MANSPLVSIRIPPEILQRIDQLAQKLYPSRRAGKSPNRSQVILDAIVQFLEQHESGETSTPSPNEQLDDAPIDLVFPYEPIDDEEINKAIQQYSRINDEQIHQALQQSPKSQMLQNCPKPMEPPIREYIDWWFTYFSYMKKLTDVWFRGK